MDSKIGEPREKHPEQGENQKQTQPSYGTGRESNTGNNGRRRVLSPLHHPYTQKKSLLLPPPPNGSKVF